MKPLTEGTLFTDPQQEKRTAECPICGGVCYWPSYSCIRCGRESP